jgi:hypothetical protein
VGLMKHMKLWWRGRVRGHVIAHRFIILIFGVLSPKNKDISDALDQGREVIRVKL